VIRARRIALKVVYWLAVLILSVAILIALILLIESRDKSNVGHGSAGTQAQRPATRD
jgi:hypothetical protein